MELKPGETLEGRYRVEIVVGRGPHGSVYRAFDSQQNQLVALKVLHTNQPPGWQTQSLERFSQQAPVLALVSGENVAQLLSIGRLSDGEPYIATEYAPGITLKALVQVEGPLPCKDLALIGAEIAAAVSEGHEAGILHRNLKPQNVMIERAARGLNVRVLDFGLSRFDQVMPKEIEMLTAAGALSGTAYYLSPEVCMGRPHEERSDIYAIGCILFEMITGRPPYPADSDAKAVYSHITEAVPNIFELDPRCALPRELQTIIERCMARSTVERYETADEVARALRAVERLDSDAKFDINASHPAPVSAPKAVSVDPEPSIKFRLPTPKFGHLQPNETPVEPMPAYVDSFDEKRGTAKREFALLTGAIAVGAAIIIGTACLLLSDAGLHSASRWALGALDAGGAAGFIPALEGMALRTRGIAAASKVADEAVDNDTVRAWSYPDKYRLSREIYYTLQPAPSTDGKQKVALHLIEQGLHTAAHAGDRGTPMTDRDWLAMADAADSLARTPSGRPEWKQISAVLDQNSEAIDAISGTPGGMKVAAKLARLTAVAHSKLE